MNTTTRQEVIDRILSGSLSKLEIIRLAERHHMLAYVCKVFDWDYEGEKAFLQAEVDKNVNKKTT